jgi:hypothetical protein
LLAEFAIEQSGQDDRRAALLAAVEDWIGQGVPIDGIAIQSHLQPAIALDKAALREFLRALRGLGLDIVISEFDFREISALALGDTAAFAAIKAYAVEYLGLVLGEGADTVVTWGVSPEDWAATGTEQVAAVPFGVAPEHTTTTLYDALIQELESRYARADGVATAESLSEAGLATGSAAGISTVAALGEADFAAAAAAVGTSTVAALSEVDFAAAAAATGASTVAAQASSAAAASGTSTADALADAVAATVGSAAGTATAAAQTSSEALAAGSATVVGSSDPGRATGASDASALVGAVGVAYVDAAGVSTNTVLANAVGAPLVDAEVVAAGSSAATAGSMSEASAAGAATAAAQPASTAAASGAATVLSIGDFGSVGSSAGTSTAVSPSTIFATADAAASGAATVIGWGATGPLYADDLSGHSELDVDLYGMAA